VRHSRRLVGAKKVLRAQWPTGVPHADEIGVSPSLAPKFPNISIPYGCLVPVELEGLLACGRHVSCDANSHSFLREIPQCWVTGQAAGTAAALAVAATNASRHGVDRRVTFVRGDLLEPVQGPVDVIVSNPPYVPAGVELSPDIVRFEPSVALYSGHDGLTLVKRLVGCVASRLAPDGLFVTEFGFGQDEEVVAFARAAGWRDVGIKEDFQGIPRVAVMRK